MASELNLQGIEPTGNGDNVFTNTYNEGVRFHIFTYEYFCIIYCSFVDVLLNG